MTPAFVDPAAERLWRAYFADVDRIIARSGPGAEDLREDLRDHLAESYSSEGNGAEVDRLQAAINRLGRPADYLHPLLADELLMHGSRTYHPGVGTQNGPRYTLRFCRAFDGAHLAKRSERGGWRIGIGPEVIAGEIDMLPTER